MMRIPNIPAAAILALVVVLVVTASTAAKDIGGILTSVEPEKYNVTLLDEFGDVRTFRMRVDGHVFINDEKRSLEDLRPRDRISLAYELEDDELVATLIRCTRN